MSTATTSAGGTKYTPLQTSHLASQNPTSETTLQTLLDHSDALAQEARETLPYSFDECTYSKGYLRQSVWACINCGGRGVCYGCSISCHSDHELVELWTRRHFRCDCPTTSICGSPEMKRRRCTLNPPDAQPQEDNEENVYNQNYKGLFCRCGRVYDAENEKEGMLCCIGCEDWFHESCLNLCPPPVVSELAKPDGKPENSTTIPETQVVEARDSVGPAVVQAENEDEDDEEKAILIPSDTYDGLICAACAEKSAYVHEQKGKDGWMIIEPNEGEQGGYLVVGRENTGEAKVGEKRSANDNGDEAVAKRMKSDCDVGEAGSTGSVAVEVVGSASGWKGKGDVFLGHGVRERLLAQLDAETAASLPFPLEDEEIYEPPQDEDDEVTLEEATTRAVESLPRVQAIEALHGFQSMTTKLKGMFAGHVQDGRAVSKEDIEGFFAELRAGRAR